MKNNGTEYSLNGIEICVDKTQREGYSFELQKGCQTVNGEIALNWVVSRNTEVLVGEKIIDENGNDNSEWQKMAGVSDLTRIKKEQYIVSSLLSQVKGFGNINSLFKNYDNYNTNSVFKNYDIINDFTKNLSYNKLNKINI